MTGRQIQEYMSAHAGVDLHRVFEQYLTTTKVPVLEYRIDGAALTYRWANVVPGFDMPVAVLAGKGRSVRLSPTEQWQTTDVGLQAAGGFPGRRELLRRVRSASTPRPRRREPRR